MMTTIVANQETTHHQSLRPHYKNSIIVHSSSTAAPKMALDGNSCNSKQLSRPQLKATQIGRASCRERV